jgi:hypothetical protein
MAIAEPVQCDLYPRVELSAAIELYHAMDMMFLLPQAEAAFHRPCRIKSAARSASMMIVAFVLARGISGIADASITRR